MIIIFALPRVSRTLRFQTYSLKQWDVPEKSRPCISIISFSKALSHSVSMLEFIPFPAKDEQMGCKNLALALARFNLLECCPAHQKVGGSTPRQGMYLSCRFHPPWGVWGSNRLMFLSYMFLSHMFLSHIDVSLSLSLSLSLPSSFSQINAYNLRWGLKKKEKELSLAGVAQWIEC